MTELLARAGLALLRALAGRRLALVRALGAGLGALLWHLARPRRRVALVNLALCFPGWSEARRREVARAHFRQYAQSFLDRAILWWGPRERVESLVRLEGLEHLEAVGDRPVILLAPHFVGLDAGGLRMQLAGCRPMMSMYANQKSRVLSEAMTAGRTRFGGQMVSRYEGLRAVVRRLREGVAFYFLPDMDLGARDAVFVPFFGVPAATVTSVARLAQLTGAAVVPLVTTMVDDGYVARLHPAWDDFPGADVERATARMNAFIEARVLEAPSQYLWTHRRFKTRPEGEPDVYRVAR